MNVLQVLKSASLYLNLFDEFNPVFNGEGFENLSEEEQREFGKILSALNLIVCEVASEYVDLLTEEIVSFKNKQLDVCSLNKNLHKVFYIFKNNKKIKFKVVDGKICCDVDGEVRIVYSYIPEELAIGSSLEFLISKLSLKTLALGVASEYCFISGFFDDAKIWEERFVKSLQGNLKRQGKVSLPNRGWL